MNNLKLIVESDYRSCNTVKKLIKEGADGNKDYFIEGIFIQTEAKNRNGRWYPKNLMIECVNKYIAERMNSQHGIRSFGELGHPDGVEINLDRVSHYVVDLKWNGNDVVGKAKIMAKNPSGRIVQTFLEEGLTLGVSTRGLGALSKKERPDGAKFVDAYDMIAIDIVADPSAPKGFVDGILENKEYIIQDNGIIVEAYERLEQNLSSLPTKSEDRQKLFVDEMEKFLINLKQ